MSAEASNPGAAPSAPAAAPAAAPGAPPLAPAAPTTPPATGSCHRFENVEFDELMGELRVAGQPVAMEPRPLQVLKELLLRVNEVVTKEELFDAAWKDRVVVDHVLANAISKLRSALGEAGGARIVTVPRVGYRLNGPVQRVDTVMPRTTFAAGQTVPGRESFVLERALGEASRSEVWLARHGKLGHQQVFKFASDGPGLSALKREYTLFRVLNKELGPRDDLATIRDTQFQQAPYFIECDYGGPNLLRWAEESGRLLTMTRDERLALFLQITRAVAAAHSVGVLHKDLKPANVLVWQPTHPAADEGSSTLQIKLTDFGSGRMLSPDRLQRLNLTALGMTQGLLPEADTGTFMYLAPEWAVGAASTVKADIYSLGVMLYQLLVADLKRPMASGWQREVDDPLLVLDILAATEGQPEQRLDSVAELASRLQSLPERRQRLLAQAEAQRRQGVLEAKEQRQRTRRPWVVLAGVLASAGAAVSMWFATDARLALKQSLEQTRKLQAFEEFLTQDVLAEDAVFFREGVRPQGMGSSLRLAAARLEDRFPADKVTQLSLRLRMAKLLRGVGAVQEAFLQAEAAYGLANQMPERPTQLLDATVELALCSQLAHRAEQVETLLAAAMKLGGSDLLLADRAEALPIVELWSREQLGLGRYTEGGKLARRWIELADKHTPRDAANRLQARAFLLEATLAASDLKEAQAVAEQMDTAVAGLGGTTRAMLAQAERNVADMVADRGEFAAATALLESAIARATQAGPGMELQLALHWASLGRVLVTRGELEKSLNAVSRAAELFQRTLGDDHQFYRVLAVQVAKAQAMLGRYQLAADSLQQHRAWFARVKNGRPHEPLHETLALSLAGLRQPEAALALLDELAADARRKGPAGDARPDAPSPTSMMVRGWAQLQLGIGDGLALMRQGLDLDAQYGHPHTRRLLEAAWATEAGKRQAAVQARP